MTKYCKFSLVFIISVCTQAYSGTHATCGIAQNQFTDKKPTKNLCVLGIPSSVEIGLSVGRYVWTCESPKLITQKCFANRIVKAKCGAANSVISEKAPKNNLCEIGRASPVDTSANKYLWNCRGVNEGASSQCAAPMKYASDSIVIKTQKQVSYVSPNFFGANFLAWMFKNKDLDINNTGADSLAASLNQIGVSKLRFPGGNFSQSYVWKMKDPATQEEKTDQIPFPGLAVGATKNYDTDIKKSPKFSDFCAFVKAPNINIKPVYVVNIESALAHYDGAPPSGSEDTPVYNYFDRSDAKYIAAIEASAATAAAWVKEAKEKGCPPAQWEIGNESNHSTEVLYAFGAAEYANVVIRHIKKMRESDPNIKVAINNGNATTEFVAFIDKLTHGNNLVNRVPNPLIGPDDSNGRKAFFSMSIQQRRIFFANLDDPTVLPRRSRDEVAMYFNKLPNGILPSYLFTNNEFKIPNEAAFSEKLPTAINWWETVISTLNNSQDGHFDQIVVHDYITKSQINATSSLDISARLNKFQSYINCLVNGGTYDPIAQKCGALPKNGKRFIPITLSEFGIDPSLKRQADSNGHPTYLAADYGLDLIEMLGEAILTHTADAQVFDLKFPAKSLLTDANAVSTEGLAYSLIAKGTGRQVLKVENPKNSQGIYAFASQKSRSVYPDATAIDDNTISIVLINRNDTTDSPPVKISIDQDFESISSVTTLQRSVDGATFISANPRVSILSRQDIAITLPPRSVTRIYLKKIVALCTVKPPATNAIKNRRELTSTPSEGIQYANAKNQKQYFDYYEPAGILNPPLIVMIHGGGWVGGSKSDEKFVKIANSFVAMGYAVANFNYPLNKTGEHPFPTAISALRCGLRYLNANGGLMGFDNTRVATWGSSAGGNLSTLLAYGNDESPALNDPETTCSEDAPMLKLSAHVGYYGIYDLRNPAPSIKSMLENYLHKTIVDDPVGYQNLASSASPITLVNENTVPTLLVHGLKDNLVDPSQSESLYSKLQTHGVESQLVEVSGQKAGHGFSAFEIDNPDQIYIKESTCVMQSFLMNQFK